MPCGRSITGVMNGGPNATGAFFACSCSSDCA